MAGYSIDRNKGKVSDIKQNLDIKKNELADLETNKQELLEAGTEIQASDLDEGVQQKIMEQINRALEENAEKGEALSEEMNSDFEDIEDMRQETQDSMQSNDQEKSKLEQKKALLDKFGLGGALEDGISELDDNRMDMEAFMDDLSNTEKELSEVSQKLSSL